MAIQNTQEVNKERLPDIKLNLMHKIHCKHTELAQTEYCELARKSTLKKIIEMVMTDRGQMRTAVGTRESFPKSLFTAVLSTV
jgi:hypothetical protein